MNTIDVVTRMEEAGAAVEDHCECGRPVGEHDYWEDKIYDVNGLRCQANWNREYRQSPIVTKRKRLEAKVAVLERLLPAPATSTHRDARLAAIVQSMRTYRPMNGRSGVYAKQHIDKWADQLAALGADDAVQKP